MVNKRSVGMLCKYIGNTYHHVSIILSIIPFTLLLLVFNKKIIDLTIIRC